MIKKIIKNIKKYKLILFSVIGIMILCIYLNKSVEHYETVFKDVDKEESSCSTMSDYLKSQQKFNDMTKELEKIKALQDKELEKRMKEKEASKCNKTTMPPLSDEQIKNYLKQRMKDKLDANFDKLTNQKFNDLLMSFRDSKIDLNSSKLSSAREALHKHLHNWHDGDDPIDHGYESHGKKIRGSASDVSHSMIKSSKVTEIKKEDTNTSVAS